MMGRAMGAVSALAVAVGIGVGAAALATDRLHDHRADELAAAEAQDHLADPGDRVRNAIDGVLEDGVYVAPDARTMLSKRAERAVVKAVAASDTDVHVVVWTNTRFAGSTSGTQTRRQLEAGLEPHGRAVLLVWEGPADGYTELLGGRGYLRISAYEDFVGDPATTLPALVASVDEQIEWYADLGAESDYWGGRGGGIAAGVLIGSGALLAIGAVYGVLVLVTRRRLPGGWV